MPRRTDYSTRTTFVRPAPAAVTYDLSVPNQATITLPPGSTWTSGSHWHETHTEYLQVLRGAAEVRLSGTILEAVTKNNGVIIVPRGVVHEWRRSRETEPEHNADLVVKEWTDPKDGGKEIFFRNLNGMILDFVEDLKAREGKQQWPWPYTLWRGWMLDVELRSLFWRCDNWPVLLDEDWWPSWVQTIVTKGLLGLSVLIGDRAGRSGVYREYSRASDSVAS